MRWPAFGLLLLGANAACTTPKNFHAPAPGAETGALQNWPEEVSGEFDLTELALIVSGLEHAEERATARARLEEIVAPILSRSASVADPEARGRALLSELYRNNGPLSVYDPRATTLREIIAGGRYNCLSATILYNLLADRLGLYSEAELLPTHARTVLRLPGHTRTVVETTSPAGFRPSPEVEERVLAQVGVRRTEGVADDLAARVPSWRSIVPNRGLTVSNLELVAAIYVNRASLEQEAGRIPLAEHLFARAESLLPEAKMRATLHDQRAALLSQLAADDMAAGTPAAIHRAFDTALAAARLDPQDLDIRNNVHQNLRAAAERAIVAVGHSGPIDGVKSILQLAGAASGAGLEARDRSGLRAFALCEIARLRLAQEDLDGAIDAIDQGLDQELGPADEELKHTLQSNRLTAIKRAAVTSAHEGDYVRSMELVARLETGFVENQADERLQALLSVGEAWLARQEFVGAAEAYRVGLRLDPQNLNVRSHLIAALEEQVILLIGEGRCAESESLLGEVDALTGNTDFTARARLRCLANRAGAQLESRQYPEAISTLRHAYTLAPRDALVARNLAVGLLQSARTAANDGQCQQARAWLSELRELHIALPSRQRAEATRLTRCRPIAH